MDMDEWDMGYGYRIVDIVGQCPLLFGGVRRLFQNQQCFFFGVFGYFHSGGSFFYTFFLRSLSFLFPHPIPVLKASLTAEAAIDGGCGFYYNL